MIVNRKMAEQARADLEIAPELDTIDAAYVQTMYKLRAMQVHPDKGGTADAFARVDRAKHILLKWLEREASPATSSLTADLCDLCGGSGFIRLRTGFSTGLRRQCTKCRGTGDLNHEPDITN